jgi:hypothetical protein
MLHVYNDDFCNLGVRLSIWLYLSLGSVNNNNIIIAKY